MANIYWQRQSGGLCRMHALNAFFGEERITPAQFSSLCKEFDKYILAKGYRWCQVNKFDCIYSSQETVVSYIVGKYTKQYCLHLPIGKMPEYLKKRKTTLADLIGDDEFIFVYNLEHIWGMRYIAGEGTSAGSWYKVDSIGGVRRSNLPTCPKLGVIIPRHSTRKDLEYNQKCIEALQPIEDYINRSYEDERLLGHLEILLATTAHMIALESGFKFIRQYFQFLTAYEKDPNNIDICISHIPALVKRMIEYDNT